MLVIAALTDEGELFVMCLGPSAAIISFIALIGCWLNLRQLNANLMDLLAVIRFQAASETEPSPDTPLHQYWILSSTGQSFLIPAVDDEDAHMRGAQLCHHVRRVIRTSGAALTHPAPNTSPKPAPTKKPCRRKFTFARPGGGDLIVYADDEDEARRKAREQLRPKPKG